MLPIAYGQSYFPTIRRDGLVYVDKTEYIRLLEAPAWSFAVLLRPRRFGKSTLLSTLEHYYDRNQAERFEELYGGLAIGRRPTPRRHRYLTLRLEFTGINTDGTLRDCQRSVYLRLRDAVDSFCHDYRGVVPELEGLARDLDFSEYPAALMSRLLGIVRNSGQPVFLLVDEYDNFTNALIARGREELYLQLTHDGGFMRELYKAFKGGMATGAIGRMFLTGVSPVTLDDITSGANIFVNLSQEEELSGLLGFTGAEVAGLVDQALAEAGYTLDRAVVLRDLQVYYNGYRFSRRAAEPVYNPDMVLYFLMKMRPPTHYPQEILDNNVRIDYGRLRSLLFEAGGAPRQGAINTVRAALETAEVDASLRESFPLLRAYDEEYFASLLYYLGMLTQSGPGQGGFRLVVPNTVSRQLYLEAFAYLVADLAQVPMVGQALEESIKDLSHRGDPAPFLTILQTRVLQYLSRRDQIKLDERAVKFIALAYVGMVDLFVPFSEMEHVGGFSDMLLPVNTRKYPDAQYSWMFEFKYLKVAAAGQGQAAGKGRAARRSRGGGAGPRPGAASGGVPAVERALGEAEEQLGRYLLDPRLAAFAGPRGWRSVAVVCVGAQALYFREPGQATRRAA